MFSYYGSKSKIVHLYPPPQHDTIIEPFAGSARYALKYWDRQVILVEKWYKVAQIWRFLVQASPQDILGLPKPNYKESLNDYALTDAERWLVGFLIARGSRRPNLVAQKYNNVGKDLKRIADNLPKIKHWQIIEADYTTVENREATWFIDPPYQVGGELYNLPQPDYQALAEWCKTRQGQAIVCENTKANWLPFASIASIQGAWKKSVEAVWLNQPIEKQQNLF
jgi:site-specific DNA-adenine methylase